MLKDSKACNDGFRRKILTDAPVSAGCIHDGIGVRCGGYSLEGTEAEMEALVLLIQSRIASKRAYAKQVKIERDAAKLATVYLRQFGEVIHKGESPERYPLLERDFSGLSMAAEIAIDPDDAEAVKKHTRGIIRYRLDEVKGYEKIAEAVRGRKASDPATLAA